MHARGGGSTCGPCRTFPSAPYAAGPGPRLLPHRQPSKVASAEHAWCFRPAGARVEGGWGLRLQPSRLHALASNTMHAPHRTGQPTPLQTALPGTGTPWRARHGGKARPQSRGRAARPSRRLVFWAYAACKGKSPRRPTKHACTTSAAKTAGERPIWRRWQHRVPLLIRAWISREQPCQLRRRNMPCPQQTACHGRTYTGALHANHRIL